jgi:hypothetical protein
MAIARQVDCDAWHREYCELYWECNEYQIIGTAAAQSLVRKMQARMGELIRLLGYTPAP